MMKVEIKVTRIVSCVHAGFWQWRMRRGEPNKPGWNGRWFARCNQPFIDADAANKSARRMGDLMKTTGAEVIVTPGKYDFPGPGKAPQRNKTERCRRIAAGMEGPYAELAKMGIFVVKESA